MAAEFKLELYVVGHSSNSRAALSNLRRICDEKLKGRYDLQVVDVLEQPELAEAANVIATPALVKRAPLPVRMIVGDLTQTERVLHGLDLDADDAEGGSSER